MQFISYNKYLEQRVKEDPELAELILMTYITKELEKVAQQLLGKLRFPADEAGGSVDEKEPV